MSGNGSYNLFEEQEITSIVFYKETLRLRQTGVPVEDAEIAALDKKEASRRHYALEFLKKLEKKLTELSNQEIANLLLALIANGLPIETEEELEFWIKKLERESLHRIAVYFIIRNEGLSKPGSLKMAPNHKKKLLKNVKDFTSEDIEAFASMMTSVNRIFERREPANRTGEEYKKFLERKKFFKRVEKLLKQDAQEKKKEERRRLKANDKEKPNDEPDYLNALKEKMSREGVEPEGKYWNSVISDFDKSENKARFVETWEKNEAKQMALDYPDNNKQEQIQKLRGIDNLEERRREETSQNDKQQKSQKENNQSSPNAAAQQAAQAQAQASAGR